MKKMCSKQLRRIEEAAELRACGVSWKKIADDLGIQSRFVRDWPERYPELWARLYSAAVEQTRIDSELEAVAILRELLRSKDEKLRRAAAHNILTVEKADPVSQPTNFFWRDSTMISRTLTTFSRCRRAANQLLRQSKLIQSRRNPTDFAAFCLTDRTGRPLRLAPVHRELQAFLTQHRRALIELPRDHGKSVQVCARLLWELGRDPGLRIKIVCASEALAAERGRFLRDAIRGNPRLRLVFPRVRPAQPWEATTFTITRAANVLGPSVAAIGIGGASTGARADLLVCDDIVDVKALRSKADRDRVRTFFHENLVNLLEPDGRLWCLFTPWHVDDLNSHLKRNGEFAHFRRAIGDDLTSIWPEHWPRERLLQRQREIGAVSFARAYRLVCVSDSEVPIRAEWIRFWTEPALADATVLAIDPAVSTKATADASALVTLARTSTNEIRCIEATARRVAAPDLVGLIDDADRRWRPDAILFEANAAFAAVRDLLIRHTRFGPKIKSVVQSRDKSARIHAFSVPVENGSFRLQGDGHGGVAPGQQTLFDEMTTFPAGDHDDLVDAAAFGTEWLLNRPEPRVW